MWVIAMFDLPTETAQARKKYARFRNSLLKDGFTMMQYSVYIRHCASIEIAKQHATRMGRAVPDAGEVRFLVITDRQFGRMQTFVGKTRVPTEQAPAQLMLL
jgi:CRISPR-associated protein Cas2